MGQIHGRTLILTHGDTDGVSSAAQFKHIYPDSSIFFTHPHGILGDLEAQFTDSFRRLVILDIALDQMIWRELVDRLNELTDKVEIIYIDHHPPPPQFESKKLLFSYIWGRDVSTSELAYKYLYREEMNDMSRVALYGGIGDYSDETWFMKKMYNFWDKRMVYFEGGLISQALESSRRRYDIKRKLVDILSRNRLPSEYPEIVERAIKMSLEEEEMRERLKTKMIELNTLAYAIDIEGSVGRAAKYMMAMSGKPVGIAIERRRGEAIMSLRAKRRGIDLNSLLRRIAPAYGGSGGGHESAAGARVNIDMIESFLKHLDREIMRLMNKG
jgi:RecJ-like exonuclease